MHEVLVNRLGGLSLPRKSVVRLTDRPDMTLDVYRGRKTTIQQLCINFTRFANYNALQKQDPMLFWPFHIFSNFFKVKKIFVNFLFLKWRNESDVFVTSNCVPESNGFVFTLSCISNSFILKLYCLSFSFLPVLIIPFQFFPPFLTFPSAFVLPIPTALL